MTRSEEILCEVFGCDLKDLSEAVEYEQHRTYDVDKIIKAMTQYAIEMCEKQKKICLEQVTVGKKGAFGIYWHDPNVVVDDTSILNSRLPEELINEKK